VANRPEAALLAEALELRERLRDAGARASRNSAQRAAAAYFLGSQLTRNLDRRARPYLLQAIKLQPWHLKSWLRLAQSLITGSTAVADEARRAGEADER
jgi:hypothetical protein